MTRNKQMVCKFQWDYKPIQRKKQKKKYPALVESCDHDTPSRIQQPKFKPGLSQIDEYR